MSRIKKLQAKDIKRLKTVSIVPDTNVIKITGANAQGKTSVLDSIWWSLGGKGAVTGKPVREGQKTAKIKLTIGMDGDDDLVVTRQFTASGGNALLVEQGGKKLRSPQKVLDDLCGEIAFDPLSFMRKSDKDQAKALQQLVPDFDFEDAAGRRLSFFDARTDLNRDIKRVKATLGDGEVDEKLPEDPVDISDLRTKMGTATNLGVERATIESRITDGKNHIKNLQDQAKASKAKLKELEEALKNLPEPVDMSDINAQLDAAEETNRRIRENNEVRKTTADLKTLETQAEGATARIKMIDEEVSEAIGAADMPVDGLSFDGESVSFNKLPLNQASGAEQLKVAMGIAMAMNPKLRVLRITDASLLDEVSLDQVEAMAEEMDFQVWLEFVDSSGKSGIWIHDGEVREADEDEAA